MSEWLCGTCAVEQDGEPSRVAVCPICADERQYVPSTGQVWTTVADLVRRGHRLESGESERSLTWLTARPRVGIGQTAQLVVTPVGNLLWDPPGLITDEGIQAVRSHGQLVAVAASHPHMFGVQVAWAKALDSQVLVNSSDREWLQRGDDRVEFWQGRHEVLPGLTMYQLGGHFRGSAIAHWESGADGRGVVLAGDTVAANPDGSASFMRSYPNNIPLSGGVAMRIVDALEGLRYDRLYSNFGNVIRGDAKRILRFSAERHAAWAPGDHDHLA